jgi:hypothetical protein
MPEGTDRIKYEISSVVVGCAVSCYGRVKVRFDFVRCPPYFPLFCSLLSFPSHSFAVGTASLHNTRKHFGQKGDVDFKYRLKPIHLRRQ